MKEIKEMGSQGDVLFRRVNAIPKSAKPVKRKGPVVVAHSETGHNHVINTPDVVLYETADPFTCYLRMEGAYADIEHLRPYDTHETMRLLGSDKPTCFQVRRQREHAPEGWRMVQD